MRPTPIPDDEIMDGHARMVIGPPAGHELTGDIRSVEAQVCNSTEGPIFRMRIMLEPGDLERLAAGEPFWLSMWGGVVPFDVALTEPT